MPAPQSDRRRARRALADFAISLSPEATARPARLKDISEIGLACTFSEAIAELTLVAVDLQLPGHKDSQRVQGAVVRCEPFGKKGECDVAVYFTAVPATTEAALRNYVQKARPAP